MNGVKKINTIVSVLLYYYIVVNSTDKPLCKRTFILLQHPKFNSILETKI
jgi:hypothetical protein